MISIDSRLSTGLGLLHLVEVILVQLAHKRRKVGMLEMLWKNTFGKVVHVLATCQTTIAMSEGTSSYLYNEAIAFVIPANRLGVRCIFEHSTEL